MQVAREVADLMRTREKEGRFCVLALGSGAGTHGVYRELVRMHQNEGLSFSNTIIFNVSEFFPLEADAPGTSKLLHEVLIDLIDIDPQNVYTPDGTIAKESIFDFCKDYEKKIEKIRRT